MFRSRLLSAALVPLLSTLPALAQPPGPDETSSGGTARPSNKLNPAISVNGLLLGSWRQSDTGDESVADDPGYGPATGITLQEAEIVFSATVDPYFKADVIAAFADRGPDEEGFETDIEEAYVTGLRLPRRLGLRAGKMLLPFGRHNLLHTHAFPFISAPLVSTRVLGEEGLNEASVEASYLVPLNWYSQFVIAVSDGRNEMFEGSRNEDLAYFAHLKNVWDLSESSTLQLGVSGLYGKSGQDGASAMRTLGADLTWKLRPLRRSIYHAFEVQAEYMHRSGDAAPESPETRISGGYIHGRWQVMRRWWLESRYDRVEREPGDDRESEDRVSALVAFAPSEFSALRLEYATLSPYQGDRDHQLRLQLGWSIGPHLAHGY